MSNKKSYMDKLTVINEGFFDRIAQFLKRRPKITNTRQKKHHSARLRRDISSINKAVAAFEKQIKKELGNDYPDLPRFEPEDFIR